MSRQFKPVMEDIVILSVLLLLAVCGFVVVGVGTLVALLKGGVW